jgi:hypothetical protein
VPSTTQSSFGELHRQIADDYVEESLIKIVRVKHGAVVAFAGIRNRAFATSTTITLRSEV